MRIIQVKTHEVLIFRLLNYYSFFHCSCCIKMRYMWSLKMKSFVDILEAKFLVNPISWPSEIS